MVIFHITIERQEGQGFSSNRMNPRLIWGPSPSTEATEQVMTEEIFQNTQDASGASCFDVWWCLMVNICHFCFWLGDVPMNHGLFLCQFHWWSISISLQWIPVGLIQTRVVFGRSPVSLATWLHNITYRIYMHCIHVCNIHKKIVCASIYIHKLITKI